MFLTETKTALFLDVTPNLMFKSCLVLLLATVQLRHTHKTTQKKKKKINVFIFKLHPEEKQNTKTEGQRKITKVHSWRVRLRNGVL